MLDCVAPDGLVHGPANWLLSRILACVGYNSLDRPRVALDSPVCQQPTASCHIDRGPTVNRSTEQSGAPQKQKVANQGILFPRTVHCPMCIGQSGAPVDRRQPEPSNWSSNVS
jgi:hypothetical protein